MKRVNIFLLTVLIASVGFAGTLSAQWVPLVYKTYGISFKAPKGFKITQNDAEGFVANGATFSMEIYPWSDAEITSPVDIAQAAFDEMNAEEKEIVGQGPITLTGFKGHKVIGTGTQEGNVLVYALGGYLNPKNATNFKVICTFWFDEKTYNTNYKAAEYILASFKAVK